MKNVKFHFLLFAMSALIAPGNFLKAQSNPDVEDFIVFPVYKINQDSSMQDVLIQFKITDIANTGKVYISFGTAKDKDDVRTIAFDKVKKGGKYFLREGNKELGLKVNIEFSEIMTFSKNDWNRIEDISIYITDKANKASKRKNTFKMI
jgi:hypothetical protein